MAHRASVGAIGALGGSCLISLGAFRVREWMRAVKDLLLWTFMYQWKQHMSEILVDPNLGCLILPLAGVTGSGDFWETWQAILKFSAKTRACKVVSSSLPGHDCKVPPRKMSLLTAHPVWRSNAFLFPPCDTRAHSQHIHTPQDRGEQWASLTLWVFAEPQRETRTKIMHCQARRACLMLI